MTRLVKAEASYTSKLGFFMEFSAVEIAAIGRVFDNPENRLCYWHILRALRTQSNSKISSSLFAGEAARFKTRI